jgi:hypothetical protein
MSVLGQALEDYLRLRRALGFRLERHGRLLPSLVSHLESAGAATVTTQLALTWATAVEGKPGEWRSACRSPAASPPTCRASTRPPRCRQQTCRHCLFRYAVLSQRM